MFPLKLPGIRAPFGQGYAEFTVFETKENHDFFEAQLTTWYNRLTSPKVLLIHAR